MGIPAIVTAGDGQASRAVYGQSKVFLELAGLPLVAHVVRALQQVPEVDEVWVVGDLGRLRAALERTEVEASLTKPLHLIPQHRHLWENCWQAYRHCLSGSTLAGRDPQSEEDLDRRLLYLSGDLPFATPQEISSFIERSLALEADYTVGLVEDHALAGFLPASTGGPGIEVAYFNLREARYRQNNLHLCRPGRLRNRHYIEEMYQHRHQRELGNMVKLALRLLVARQGGLTILFFYALMHLAGVLDRHGLASLADRVRRMVGIERAERAAGRLLGTRFRFVVTDVGGCAIDVDTEREYDACCERYDEWCRSQTERAEKLHGPPALGAGAERR